MLRRRVRLRSESRSGRALLRDAADASCANVQPPLEHVEEWVAVTDGGFERAPPDLGIVSVAIACALLVPHAKGSGLPALIAYCNGCKLKGFTSKRTLAAKLVGTICSLASGNCVGPEGPIIHMGSCLGKQLLLMLHTSASFGPRRLVAAFSHLRNDLDQRDAVALGAGAGITAAFSTISCT